jgi:hypothetical protein
MNIWLAEMDDAERSARFGDMVLNYPERVKRANDDVQFAVWIFEVDHLLVERVMADHSSMTDWCWHDAFSDDYSPEDDVNEFLDSEMDALLSAVGEL